MTPQNDLINTRQVVQVLDTGTNVGHHGLKVKIVHDTSFALRIVEAKSCIAADRKLAARVEGGVVLLSMHNKNGYLCLGWILMHFGTKQAADNSSAKSHKRWNRQAVVAQRRGRHLGSKKTRRDIMMTCYSNGVGRQKASEEL
ncbi:hypothetical protein N7452_003690 [Penicillium brevicompactum]|uniref:Uncharacterized protein n=1 Tax=Penicillium brevicompactum TaxID=5074 RepID=A0A9W9UKD8_PENBR|nr:hypothetical protein N7452_003690 [Penicillium brevicompactum]